MKRPQIYLELEKQEPCEKYYLNLTDMFRLWEATGESLREHYLKDGLSTYKGEEECLTFKGYPVFYKPNK